MQCVLSCFVHTVRCIKGHGIPGRCVAAASKEAAGMAARGLLIAADADALAVTEQRIQWCVSIYLRYTRRCKLPPPRLLLTCVWIRYDVRVQAGLD